jgi:hypothetical protein
MLNRKLAIKIYELSLINDKGDYLLPSLSFSHFAGFPFKLIYSLSLSHSSDHGDDNF